MRRGRDGGGGQCWARSQARSGAGVSEKGYQLARPEVDLTIVLVKQHQTALHGQVRGDEQQQRQLGLNLQVFVFAVHLALQENTHL